MAKNNVKKSIKKLSKLKHFGLLLIIVVIMLVAFVLYCYLNPEMYNAIFNKSDPVRPKDNLITYYTSSYVVEDGKIDDLKIHMVDVGQGDCFIIQLPDGSNVLIDAAKSSKSSEVIDYANSLNITTFDVVIITHSDEDHIGGMDEVFEAFEVKNCYRPYVYYGGTAFEIDPLFNEGASTKNHNTDSYGKVLNAIYNETYVEDGTIYYCSWEYFNYESSFGREIVYGDATYVYNFDFLTPYDYLEDIDYTNLNDFSPYILFTYGLKGEPEGETRFDMLLTGDAEKDALNELLSNYSGKDLDVDVLKTGHHGSQTSTTKELLDLIKPEYALISCGLNNTYKHPHQSVLDLFIQNDVVFYRTDLHGDVVLNVKSNGVFSFDSQKSPADGLINVGGIPKGN